MKNKYIILIAIPLLIILGYFVYKLFNLYYYNVSSIIQEEQYANFLNNFDFKNTITINTKVEDSNYLSFKNLKIRNDFSEFKKIEETNDMLEYVKYALYDKNNNVKAAIFMGITDTYVNMFKEEVTLYGDNYKRINDKGLESFFEENNITNDIEYFKYLIDNKDIKNNIFTSIKDMKSNYTIHLLSSISLPSTESLTLIEGDYTGYIFNMKKIKEVNILKNNKRYTVTFIDLNYFNDEYINELLNTIVID